MKPASTPFVVVKEENSLIEAEKGMPINLHQFTVLVAEEGGIDPYSDGINSLYTEEINSTLYFSVIKERESKSISQEIIEVVKSAGTIDVKQ